MDVFMESRCIIWVGIAFMMNFLILILKGLHQKVSLLIGPIFLITSIPASQMKAIDAESIMDKPPENYLTLKGASIFFQLILEEIMS